MLIQTDDRKHVRDTYNNALLLTDKKALTRARARRESAKGVLSLRSEIGELQAQVLQLTLHVAQLLKVK